MPTSGSRGIPADQGVRPTKERGIFRFCDSARRRLWYKWETFGGVTACLKDSEGPRENIRGLFGFWRAARRRRKARKQKQKQKQKRIEE